MCSENIHDMILSDFDGGSPLVALMLGVFAAGYTEMRDCIGALQTQESRGAVIKQLQVR